MTRSKIIFISLAAMLGMGVADQARAQFKVDATFRNSTEPG